LLALSAREIALLIKAFVLSVFAFLNVISSLEMMRLLTCIFLFELLKALLAVFVKGINNVFEIITLACEYRLTRLKYQYG